MSGSMCQTRSVSEDTKVGASWRWLSASLAGGASVVLPCRAPLPWGPMRNIDARTRKLYPFWRQISVLALGRFFVQEQEQQHDFCYLNNTRDTPSPCSLLSLRSSGELLVCIS